MSDVVSRSEVSGDIVTALTDKKWAHKPVEVGISVMSLAKVAIRSRKMNKER